MKKYILGLLVYTLTLSSCSSFLDQSVIGKEDFNTYFQNADQCEKQLNGCYQSILWNGGWWQTQKFIIVGDMCTDDMWMGNTSQDAGDYRDLAFYTGNTYNASNDCQNFWQYRYKGILRCNLCIDDIPKATISDDSLKNRLVSEAKFIRAYLYFDLARNFGSVPLMLHLQMPTDVKGVTRSSVSDVYAQAEKDLLEAIPHLPLRSQYNSSDIGRVTKGAAEGLVAKIYLYQEKYQEAETYLKDVIKSGEYALLPDFGEVWDINHNNSIESLFEIQTNSDMTYNLGLHLPVTCGSRDDSGWAWGIPTSNLEKTFIDSGDSIRLKWTIIKDSATVVPGDPAWSASKPYRVKPDEHKSARCTRKVYIPVSERPTPYDSDKNPLNYRILRYADILLMYAEVENALGHDSEAQWALNTVRARVKLASIYYTGKDLRDAIRNERRLELALEDNRLYDLRRWKDDNGKPLIDDVMGKNGTFVKYNLETSTDKYEISNQKENSNKGINFVNGRDELFPIPVSEVTMSNGSITQNPGY
jgi:starch-binding outer membrane protein, SusD/RagB family